ncbi:MAG: hypothetical protein ABF780_03870 [Bifidobacterium aquikefiri]|uniref:Uncharacterized protein n=1 Tax=Bifidobacterium aquikefiri TaxID=1653207 RepID=A0A261G149_9BIFI|nr:hypothetical protein [Bifidobacterium aquikefiri]OZG65108.1 hypothetical protein BAQU_1848 [Bifidobacterium aquikefiri]
MSNATSANNLQQTSYAGYEYTKVRAPLQLEPLYRDAYRNFGWNLESSEVRPPIRPLPLLPAIRSNMTTLSFRRDRRIKNKPLLQELQRKADYSLDSIARMERSKRSIATSIAVVLGIIGAVFLAVSLFMGALGAFPIIVGAIGLVAWAGGAIAYFGIRASRTAQLNPLIEQEQEQVFQTGEQAARLIH